MIISRYNACYYDFLGIGAIDGGTPMDLGSHYMRMLHRAGIGNFRYLQDDPAFRVQSLPSVPSEVNEVEWEEGLAHATNGASYLTFTLPEPMFVSGIRIQCSTPQPGGAWLGVAWKRSSDSDFPAPQYRVPWWPVGSVTIAVSDTIDQVRIYPNVMPGSHPCDFHLTKIEALAPESREVHVDQSMEQRMPIFR